MQSVKERLILFRDYILMHAAESGSYLKWDPEYARKNIINALNNKSNWREGEKLVEPVTIAEIKTLTIEELKEIGFRKWDASLWLIPLWMIKLVKAGETVQCIDGNKYPIEKAWEDNDHRGGMTAYGV